MLLLLINLDVKIFSFSRDNIECWNSLQEHTLQCSKQLKLSKHVSCSRVVFMANEMIVL